MGNLRCDSKKSKEAIDAINKEISKGSLRKEGEAYRLRGDAENDLDQRSAAAADWAKAAGYPSTKTMAEQRIKAAKGGVNGAHALVQDETRTKAAGVHAYATRVEGDLGNAGYWDRRAGKPVAKASLDEEWGAIVAALLAN